MWHVEVRKQTLGPEIRVHGKQELAHKGRCFEVVEEMLEEVRGVHIAGIAFLIGACRSRLDRAVVVYDNLVDRENRAGPRNTACPCCPLLTSHAIGDDTSRYRD